MKQLFPNKKTFFVFTLLFSSFLYAQEASSSNFAVSGQEQNPDSYFTGETENESDKIKIVRSTEKNKPIELGDSSLFLYGSLGFSLKQQDIIFYFYPQFNEAGFALKELTGKTNISFDLKTRQIICAAFKQYENEFNEKMLSTKSSKTVEAYGRSSAHYSYGSVGVTQDFTPDISVGYVFIKKSPYFSLTLWPVNAKNSKKASNSDESFSKTTILFNKAQARSLVKILEKESFEE